MSMPKTSKLYQYINYRMKVTLQDSRVFIGKFMAFDKHMNLVIGDCEEFRKIVPKGKKGEEREEKRTLGLIILRGESIVSMTVEGPPPAEESRVKALQKDVGQGVGIARAASRGMATPAAAAASPMPGLSAPVPHLGGPSPGSMMPSARSIPGAPPIPSGQFPPGRGLHPPPFPPGMPPPGMPLPGMPPGMGHPPFPPGRGMPPIPFPGRGLPPGMPPPPFPPPQGNHHPQ